MGNFPPRAPEKIRNTATSMGCPLRRLGTTPKAGKRPLAMGDKSQYYAHMSSTHDAFIAEIDAFLIKHKMTDAHFGIAAMNDHKFVSRLRSGASTTLRTADKVRAFMRSYRSPLGRGRRRANDGVAA